MSILAYLIPLALFLGLMALAGFVWAMRSGQYEDLEGASLRILIEDEGESEDFMQHSSSEDGNS